MEKEYSWCFFPNVVKANIIKYLNRFDLFNTCLANKNFYKMYNDNKFWTSLVRINYSKDVPEGKNARKYYYDLGTCAFVFGYFYTEKFKLSNNLFLRSVRHVVVNGEMSLFLTVDDELYGFYHSDESDESELELFYSNVKMVWLPQYVDCYYILDKNDNLCIVNYLERLTILMPNVSSVVFSDNIIYANGHAISDTKFDNVGDFVVTVKKPFSEFSYKNKPIDIKKWYSEYSGGYKCNVDIFVDTDNNLYAVMDRKTLQLAKNVENVGIACLDKLNVAIYWNIGCNLYIYNDEKTISFKFDSGIKTIHISNNNELLVLTKNGNLHKYLSGITNFDKTDSILVQSNVYKFSDSGYDHRVLLL